MKAMGYPSYEVTIKETTAFGLGCRKTDYRFDYQTSTIDYQIPPFLIALIKIETPCKPLICKGFLGALGATRTRGLQSRSLTLYPTELRAHAFWKAQSI